VKGPSMAWRVARQKQKNALLVAMCVALVVGNLLFAAPALAVVTGSAPTAPRLWLDLRGRSNAHSVEDRMKAAAAELSEVEAPKVQDSLMSLFQGVKAKLSQIGVQLPQGRGVDAVIVEESVAAKVLEEAVAMEMPIFYVRDANPEDGITTAAGEHIVGFVHDAASGELQGGLSLPASAPWQTGPAREVKQVWDKESYGKPPFDDGTGSPTPLARALPLDPSLWASALVRAARAGQAAGSGGTAYSLKRDRPDGNS